MRSFICIAILVLMAVTAHAQDKDNKSPALSKKDTIMLAKFKATGTYPLIKASPYSGVLPVRDITDKPDPTLKYKLLFDFSLGTKDAGKAKYINRGLAEIGRIINLHVAAGVPKENLDIVIVTHGQAIYTLLKTGAYKKVFKTENPNIEIVQELKNAGARFVACGQAMQFLDINSKELDPNVSIAVAAKTAVSTYQLKGYTTYEIDEED